MSEFEEFPKMARWTREVIITEKIDGTNACIYIDDEGRFYTGSRTRWITPQDDNYGFSRWAHEHQDELMELGPGRHFGEWWGSGCQRGYGLPKGEKRFSLFNVSRWGESRPACCHVVPVLYRGMNEPGVMEAQIQRLIDGGSLAAPGFMDPEGVVLFHVASGVGFKKTIKRDEAPKSQWQERSAA